MDICGDGGLPVDVINQNEGDQSSDLNISDVFEAISIADPSFGAGAVDSSMATSHTGLHAGPSVRIIEQPASKALRFRYECEGRSAGSIPGVNSTPENKRYPTIEIRGHKGRAIIVVSCVTKEEPYKPHPHNLVGRDRCCKGVCTIKTDLTEENNQVSFQNLGIQCVKRRDIADALRVREEMRVDPFKTGFAHRSQPQSIDLNAVRLCFQVFLPDEHGKVRHSLRPVVSDIIYDKKAMSDLLIMRTSHCSGTAKGGTRVIILCEKVIREETAVVFFEKENNRVIWEEPAIIQLVHKQVAIAFETPPYRNPHTSEPVQVYFQLKRQTDNARSNEWPFEYTPEVADYLTHKKRKTVQPMYHYEQENYPVEMPIKSEPRDRTPPHNMSSPPLKVFPPQDNPYQQWAMPMHGGLNAPGTSHFNPFAQDMWSNPNYAMPSNLQAMPQTLQPLSPNIPVLQQNMQPLSPVMHTMSPGMQSMSPGMQAMSPNMQAMSPNMQAMSPNMQAMSPNMQPPSPNMQVMSPGMQAVSPIAVCNSGMSPSGHISPNLQSNYNPMAHTMMDTSTNSTPSLTNLLMDRSEGAMAQINSGDLAGLSSLLNDRGPDLSDSLKGLSTSELSLLHNATEL